MGEVSNFVRYSDTNLEFAPKESDIGKYKI